MITENTSFGTVEVIRDDGEDGTELTIRAVAEDYTEEDWNAAAGYASVLREFLPPPAAGRVTEFSWHSWHPVADDEG